MKRYAGLAAACVLLFATHLSGQSGQIKEKDLGAYLAGVTERGRAIYAYDQCAWHGTDAIFSLHPDMSGMAHYICMKTPTGWEAVFPKWNATHDRLLVAYEALESGGPETYQAQKFDPPREGPDDLIAKERALELAIGDFPAQNRPYNTAILPADGGNLYVYIYPAQTKAGVWPLGGDVRYTISADGQRIIEKRQLHKTILDREFDKGTVSGFHTHVLSDVPEDTDVFFVLNRRPLISEYVGTLGGWIFVINTDGTIGPIPPCTQGNPLPCKRK